MPSASRKTPAEMFAEEAREIFRGPHDGDPVELMVGLHGRQDTGGGGQGRGFRRGGEGPKSLAAEHFPGPCHPPSGATGATGAPGRL